MHNDDIKWDNTFVMQIFFYKELLDFSLLNVFHQLYWETLTSLAIFSQPSIHATTVTTTSCFMTYFCQIQTMAPILAIIAKPGWKLSTFFRRFFIYKNTLIRVQLIIRVTKDASKYLRILQASKFNISLIFDKLFVWILDACYYRSKYVYLGHCPVSVLTLSLYTCWK